MKMVAFILVVFLSSTTDALVSGQSASIDELRREVKAATRRTTVELKRVEEMKNELNIYKEVCPCADTSGLGATHELSYDGPIKEYRFRLRWWRQFLKSGGKSTPEAWRAFFQRDLQYDSHGVVVDHANQIIKLKQLLDAGAVTPEDFEQQKAKHLSRMFGSPARGVSVLV